MEAVEHVEVRARGTATVHAMLFRQGSILRKGDLLNTIYPAPHATAVDQEKA